MRRGTQATRWRLVGTVFVVVAGALVAACGGGDDTASSTAPAIATAAPSDTTTPETTTPETTTPETAVATTTTTTTPETTTTAPPPTTEPQVIEIDSDLAWRIQGLCAWASDGSSLGELTLMMVATGELSMFIPGLSDLEQAFRDGDPEPVRADVDRLCAEAWPLLTIVGGDGASVDEPPEAVALVSIAIGDLSVSGEVDGCPLTAILGGERWTTVGRLQWDDIDGNRVQVSLAFDATQDPIGWGFEVIPDAHYLISSDVAAGFEHQLDHEVSAILGVFSTVFRDQVASASGGMSPTPGDVIIECPA